MWKLVLDKRLELSRPCGHNDLNVARLPISPIEHMELVVRFELTRSKTPALFTNALLLYNFDELFLQLIIFCQINFDIIFGFLKS